MKVGWTIEWGRLGAGWQESGLKLDDRYMNRGWVGAGYRMDGGWKEAEWRKGGWMDG